MACETILNSRWNLSNNKPNKESQRDTLDALTSADCKVKSTNFTYVTSQRAKTKLENSRLYSARENRECIYKHVHPLSKQWQS